MTSRESFREAVQTYIFSTSVQCPPGVVSNCYPLCPRGSSPSIPRGPPGPALVSACVVLFPRRVCTFALKVPHLKVGRQT